MVLSQDGYWKRAGVVVTVILFFVVQLGGGIWWASNLSTDTKAIKESMTKMEVQMKDSYTKREVEAQLEIRDARITATMDKVNTLANQYRADFGDLKNMVSRVENKIDDYIIKPQIKR